MKILILANNDVGLYKFRRELIQDLLKDNEVIISLPYGEMVDLLIKEGCQFIETSIDRRGINPLTDFKLILTYFKLILDVKPDFVITYTIKPNVYGGFVCSLLKTKYAMNITGLGTAFENDNWLKKLVVTLYKVAAKKAKVVFFENSENESTFLENRIIKDHQAKLLNGAGVNLDYFSYQDYPNNDAFRFLFIGRVMKEKGVDELFSAMKRLVKEYDCCLDVVGPFEEDYSELIEKYIEEGWLNYYGFQDDIRPFIRQCDCFVLPSYHEGMANTNLECASSGRPIITSNISGCKEAVINYQSGLICSPRDSLDLYLKMKLILETSYKKRIEMGLLGRSLMEKSFDKNTVVYETINSLGVR